MLGLLALVAGEGSGHGDARRCSMLVVALCDLHRWLGAIFLHWLGLVGHGGQLLLVGLELLLLGQRLVGLARTFGGSMVMVLRVVGLDGILHAAASVVGLLELLRSLLVECARRMVLMGGLMRLLVGILFLVFDLLLTKLILLGFFFQEQV